MIEGVIIPGENIPGQLYPAKMSSEIYPVKYPVGKCAENISLVCRLEKVKQREQQ